VDKFVYPNGKAILVLAETAGEPGLCDQAPVVRDVEQLFNQVLRRWPVGRDAKLKSASTCSQEAMKKSPDCTWTSCQADEALTEASRLPGNLAGRAVQAGTLSKNKP
jgi:hypothetical protein